MRVINIVRRILPKSTKFVDCTRSVSCCIFVFFRDPVGVSCLRRVTKPVRVKRGRSRRQREALSRKRAESIQSRLERDSSPTQLSWLRVKR